MPNHGTSALRCFIPELLKTQDLFSTRKGQPDVLYEDISRTQEEATVHTRARLTTSYRTLR